MTPPLLTIIGGLMEIDIFGVPIDLGADRRGVEMVEVNPILDV
jgi:hypothetical protein